jgi:uncharacterized protein (TIGR02145 family)
MKKRPLILIHLSVLSVLFFFLASGCKKENDDQITVTDIDGNVYNTVKIGNQVWIKTNLKVTKLNDGTNIQLVENNQTWSGLITPGYCWNSNNEAQYKNIFGALYNFHAVKTGKLCPAGWHVPTDSEWKQLEKQIGMSQSEADIEGDDRGTTEGGELKESGLDHWDNPNEGATNKHGFTALPGGYRDETTGSFGGVGGGGDWWTSTEADATSAWDRGLSAYESDISRNREKFGKGYSVRCIKN